MLLARKSISPFILGRKIMERVVNVHETIHELHPKKRVVYLLRLMLTKLMIKVKWSFVQQTLRMKGFSQK